MADAKLDRVSPKLKQAICNEIFEGWDFAAACQAIKKAGYAGVEIAPMTLSDDPARIPAARRRQLRQIMSEEGLEFVGLHWLMVAPPGLHVTTPDKQLREKSWQHIRDLVDLCADLGPGGVMVFGSPKQRQTTGGSTPQQATRRFVEGLAAVAPHAEQQGVTILIEALSPAQCDVVQTLAEAVAIVDEIGSPAIRTMFDTHNAVDEREPHHVLVDRYFDYIHHVHVNEMDGKHCGQGDYDFKPVLEVLLRRGYSRWVSLEAFDFSFGAERIANESLRYLESEIEKISL